MEINYLFQRCVYVIIEPILEWDKIVSLNKLIKKQINMDIALKKGNRKLEKTQRFFFFVFNSILCRCNKYFRLWSLID